MQSQAVWSIYFLDWELELCSNICSIQTGSMTFKTLIPHLNQLGFVNHRPTKGK